MLVWCMCEARPHLANDMCQLHPLHTSSLGCHHPATCVQAELTLMLPVIATKRWYSACLNPDTHPQILALQRTPGPVFTVR